MTFPNRNPRLIALYWDYHNVHGQIFHRMSQDPFLIAEVGTNISDAFVTSFTPSSLLIATWNQVQYVGNFRLVSISATVGSSLLNLSVGQHLPSGDCH